MTRALGWGIACAALALALGAGCNDDGGTDEGAGGSSDGGTAPVGGSAASGDLAVASDAWGGLTITLLEAGGPSNSWIFAAGVGASGTATLDGVGDFPFTYEQTGSTTSVLEFDVMGTDRYELVWTSADGGTFQESFDGAPGNAGTFTVRR